ncbi:hypothetical protein PP725_13295, partial [Ralstonia solanacearum]|nr:hypothetical protein [Ralstonia pseudosolanacearum]
MSAHPTWRDVLTDGILAERHGADLLFGSAAVRALETAAYRALAPFTLMARAGEAAADWLQARACLLYTSPSPRDRLTNLG